MDPLYGETWWEYSKIQDERQKDLLQRRNAKTNNRSGTYPKNPR